MDFQLVRRLATLIPTNLNCTYIYIYANKNIVMICMEVFIVIYVINMKLGYQLETEMCSP